MQEAESWGGGLTSRQLAGIGGLSGNGAPWDILWREADPFSIVANTAGAPVSVATGAVNTPITGVNLSLIGKCCLVENIVVGMNQPAMAQVGLPLQASPATGNVATQGTLQFYHPGTTPVVFNRPLIVRANTNTSSTSNSVSLNVRNNLTAGSVNYVGSVAVNGWRFADDLDFGAPNVAMFVGDSILNGTGPTTTPRMWPYIFKSFLASRGQRTRVVLKSVSGTTSSDHEAFRSAGYHDIRHADLIVYALGVNDAVTGVSPSTYTANLTAFWNWVASRYPESKLLVLGVSPLENNTSETNAVALRSAAAAFVASVNQPNRLAYINLGAAFDRTLTTTVYASTDTPGSRIHPNDTGHAAIASTIQAGWQALGWTV